MVSVSGYPMGNLCSLPDGVVAIATDVSNAKIIRHQKKDVGTGAG